MIVVDELSLRYFGHEARLADISVPYHDHFLSVLRHLQGIPESILVSYDQEYGENLRYNIDYSALNLVYIRICFGYL